MEKEMEAEFSQMRLAGVNLAGEGVNVSDKVSLYNFPINRQNDSRFDDFEKRTFLIKFFFENSQRCFFQARFFFESFSQLRKSGAHMYMYCTIQAGIC